MIEPHGLIKFTKIEVDILGLYQVHHIAELIVRRVIEAASHFGPSPGRCFRFLKLQEQEVRDELDGKESGSKTIMEL